jgi:threonine/homoserine/homoserine lactone efflux protein
MLVTVVLRRRGRSITATRRATAADEWSDASRPASLRRLPELAIGVALGLAAGLAPGPMLALVLSAALEGGFVAGASVAFAPLLSDVIVVPVCVLVLDGLPDEAVAAIAVGGGVFIAWLGVRQFRAARRARSADERDASARLRRAVAVNLVNPHPWLFWIGAGGPLLLRAGDRSAWAAAAFVAGFYALLVGTKVVLAGLVAAGRRRLLAGRGYRLATSAAALLLVAAGVVLAIEGISAL